MSKATRRADRDETRRRRPREPLTREEYLALRRLQALAAAVEHEIGRRLNALGLSLPPPPMRPPLWPYKLEDAAWDAGFGELTNENPPDALARDVVAFALDLDLK